MASKLTDTQMELKRQQRLALVNLFDTQWRRLEGQPLTEEYKFHPTRRWRFDRAHVGLRIAIEVDGGTWNGGRHTSGTGFRDDCIKLNAAAALGWLVFRFTSDMLQNDPAQHLKPVINLIKEYNKEVSNEPLQ